MHNFQMFCVQKKKNPHLSMCDAKRDRSGPGPAFCSRILYLLLTDIEIVIKKQEVLHMKQLLQLDIHNFMEIRHWNSLGVLGDAVYLVNVMKSEKMQDVPISAAMGQTEFEIRQENFEIVGRDDLSPVDGRQLSMSGETIIFVWGCSSFVEKETKFEIRRETWFLVDIARVFHQVLMDVEREYVNAERKVGSRIPVHLIF
ncbi:unnamed protein product [Onchocerca flexuosa]|uniref:Fmp27_GFWDK domain-containing protein n=1 Tax=Onchocerca flexuosa TaxID=387005 RepID=A0A183H3S0_9BILA|nr:unnamed protein product [Onchocerca flexuosa]